MKNLKKSKRNLYLLETPFEKMLLIENLLNNLSYFYNSLPSLKNKQSKIEKNIYCLSICFTKGFVYC